MVFSKVYKAPFESPRDLFYNNAKPRIGLNLRFLLFTFTLLLIWHFSKSLLFSHSPFHENIDIIFPNTPLTILKDSPAPPANTGDVSLKNSGSGELSGLLVSIRHDSAFRNYSEWPVTIYDPNGIGMWADCNVPCLHSAFVDKEDKIDARMGSDIMLSMESAVYYPSIDVKSAKQSGIKYVMTTRLSSDVPVGYFSWAEYGIMDERDSKAVYSSEFDAIAVISNCNGNSFRLEAVKQMESLGIRIDKYGACFDRRLSGSKVEKLKYYKFVLAFENSIEEDYVTEKFWQVLIVGSVPVVIGAPNIRDFEPIDNSILHISSLENVPAVVAEMKRLLADDKSYQYMLRWKQSGPSEKFLALLDMAVVHSACRLCIRIATQQVEETISKRLASRESNGLLGKCDLFIPKQGIVKRIFIRERGRFYYDELTVQVSGQAAYSITVQGFQDSIVKYYNEKNGFSPIWTGHRSDFKKSSSGKLKLYKIYPVGVTQKLALYGDAAIDNQEELQRILETPCPRLEVIFV